MARLLVNVDVPELEPAVQFYSAAFGLTVGRRLGDGFVELLGAELPLYLIVAKAGTPPFPGATASRAYVRHWTPVHIDLVVEDLDAALARAIAAGARLELPVERHAYGRLAVLADPFGHGFCLLELEGPGYDAIATRSADPPASGS